MLRETQRRAIQGLYMRLFFCVKISNFTNVHYWNVCCRSKQPLSLN